MELSLQGAWNTSELIFNTAGEPLKTMGFEFWKADDTVIIQGSICDKELLILNTFLKTYLASFFKVR